MPRDPAEDYDEFEPLMGTNGKARVLVVAFIVLGIFALSKMSKVQRSESNDVATMATPADSITTHHSGEVPGDVSALAHESNSGYVTLQAMLDAYKNLRSLREQTRLQISVDGNGFGQGVGTGSIRQSIDLRMSYQVPNRLRFVVSRPKNEISVACNGEWLRARISNPDTRNFDQQFVQRSSPRRVDVTTVFSATEFADPARPNALLSALLDIPIDFTVSSLGMLTDRDALTRMFKEAADIAQLSDQQIHGVPCSVVRVTGRFGNYTFWVDKATKLLRRIEHPTTRLVADEGSNSEKIRARLVSDHVCDPSPLFVAKEFEMSPPPQATLVRHFVAPPVNQDVGHLNVRVPPFAFTDLNGGEFASDRWDGRHAMLIWFNRHPTCRQLFADLQPVFERYRENHRIFFCAISTDSPTKMGHQDVRNLAANWHLPISVVRDLDLVGRDIFAVQQAPTIVITSSDSSGGSRIQVVEVGWQDQLAKQLPVVIDKLLDGENVAEDFIQFVAKRELDYQRYLASASVDAPSADALPGVAEIAPGTDFANLRLTPLWEVTELDRPGNISIDYSSGRPVLLIHNGWHEVAAVAANGSVLSRNPIPEGTEISRLQLFSIPNGETLFAGSSVGGKHAALFDSRWRQLLRYPSVTDAPDVVRVQDVLLTDLDEDDELEMYVGFAGNEGVHRVDLSGKTVWANRQVRSVLSMTAVDSESGRQLLVTGYDGSLVPIDAKGHVGQPFSVGARAIHHLMSGPIQPGQTPWYCGLTYNLHGNMFAVGLNDQLNEAWNYPLPPGDSRSQVKVGRYGQAVPGSEWQWLFAAPDGSVHVVSPDGRFHDRFNTGVQVDGLAGFQLGDTHVLVIATAGSVRAFRVSTK